VVPLDAEFAEGAEGDLGEEDLDEDLGLGGVELVDDLAKPGAPYLCIEPWQGFAPAIGDDGDLARRPGIVLVPPGGALERNLVLSPDIVPAA